MPAEDRAEEGGGEMMVMETGCFNVRLYRTTAGHIKQKQELVALNN